MINDVSIINRQISIGNECDCNRAVEIRATIDLMSAHQRSHEAARFSHFRQYGSASIAVILIKQAAAENRQQQPRAHFTHTFSAPISRILEKYAAASERLLAGSLSSGSRRGEAEAGTYDSTAQARLKSNSASGQFHRVKGFVVSVNYLILGSVIYRGV